MGFLKIKNRLTGRQVFACEAGLTDCKTYQCKAHKCPFGWCQRYYICDTCWEKPEIKEKFTKQAHENCRANSFSFKARQQQEQDLLDAGKYVRCSALKENAPFSDFVRVIFRNKDRDEIGKSMLASVYDRFDLGVPVTIEDFGKLGKLRNAPATFEDIYAGIKIEENETI